MWRGRRPADPDVEAMLAPYFVLQKVVHCNLTGLRGQGPPRAGARACARRLRGRRRRRFTLTLHELNLDAADPLDTEMGGNSSVAQGVYATPPAKLLLAIVCMVARSVAILD